MQVFKAAFKVILRHPVYLLTYIVGLSMLGIFLVSPLAASGSDDEYQAARPSYAIIDRDNSELSAGISNALARHADEVPIEDNNQALQDAVAQGAADYILIIPEGYEVQVRDALDTGEDAAELETVVSYTSIYGTLMNQVTNQYLELVRIIGSTDASASFAKVTQEAYNAMENEALVEVSVTGDAAQPSDAYVGFLMFAAYPMTVGIIVCISMLMASFSKGEVRRRTMGSPLKLTSLNMQLTLGCVLIALFACAWVLFLGQMAYGGALEGVPWENIALIVVSVLVFVSVPLSLGFLFAQIGVKENVANAAGNILGLVMSFLSGAWVSLDLLGSAVTQVAMFTPACWYADAISQLAELTTVASGNALISILGNLGVVLLFAVTFFVIALVVGKVRMQNTEAGGKLIPSGSNA